MRALLGIFLLFITLSPLQAQDTTQHYTLKFTTSNIKILSDAYLHYAGNFNDILRAFRYDSTLFSERYSDTCYIKTTLRKEFHTTSRKGELGNYYQDMDYGYFDAKVIKVNIKGEKFWALDLLNGKFKKGEDRYGFDKSTLNLFPVMIFPHIQDKKELKAFIKKYKIGDHRIFYDKLTNNFEIELKTSNSFVKKSFFPYYAEMEEKDDIQIAQLYLEKFRQYSKELFKRENQFNRDHIKEITIVKREQRKLLDKKWKTFQNMYMSMEEKKMPYETWLEYYNLIIQDEFRAVMNSEPKKGLIDRYLREIGYRYSEMDLVNPNTSLKLKGSNSFAMINGLVIVNLSQMYFCKANYSNANFIQLNFSPGDRYAILLNTVKGNYGIITATIPEDQNTLELEFKTIAKDLVSIGMFSKKAGL